MTIFYSALPKSMFRFVFGLSFLGCVFASAAHAEDTTAPVLTDYYVSSGGTLLVLEYDEVLDVSSVPAAGDFTVNDGAKVDVSAVYVVGDKVVLKLDKTIQAVDNENGVGIVVTVGYPGKVIKDPAGNFAADFDKIIAFNNSTNFPISISFNDQDSGADCGAWKIEMDGTTGGVTVFSTYCGDSMPAISPDSGALVFSETNALGSANPAYCGRFDSFNMDGSGHVRITTTDNCVVDRDVDGIPGVNDAAPNARAQDVCVEEAHGEVNLANSSVTSCSGVVSVVTGNSVTVDADTEYTAGEFMRLLPGFSVVQGAQFTARTGEFL